MTAARNATAGGAAAQARRAPLRRPPAGGPLRVKLISPAKTAADSRYWRSIKYSLFPPLGLATLAGYLGPDDEVDLQDEHVEELRLDDDPDLVVIEAYITSAGRAYRYADHYRAKGAHVCLGGLHPTSLPEEAARHADSVFCGPGEDTWPAFLRDFRAGRPRPLYRSTRAHARRPARRRAATSSSASATSCPTRWSSAAAARTSATSATRRRSSAAAGRSTCRRSTMPWPRSTASPAGTSTSSTTTSSAARRSPRRSSTASGGWAASGRRPGRSQAVLRPGLLEKAVESGLRSLFIGFETLSEANLLGAGKTQNLAPRLRRRRPPPARPGRHGQRRLRLRHGRRRPSRLRAHGRVGREPGHRDGDVPHPDAVPRHAARSGGSRPRAASPAATGTSTTRATPSSRRPA